MKRNSTVGIILVVAGALLAMKFLGLGHLISWAVSLIFPLIVLGLGVIGWRNGNRIVGGVLLFVGAIWLLGKLTPLIMLLFAVGLIVWGVSLFKGKRIH
ncbi:LiaF transmembrane domain-containing protein [Paenibacillus sp. D51F]